MMDGFIFVSSFLLKPRITITLLDMSQELLILIQCAFCSFCITYFSIPSVINLAYQKNLLDQPNERKVHVQLIPSLGGIGIFIGVLISFTLFCSLGSLEAYKYILTSYLILFFMGVKDDLLPMAASKKLVIQICVAALIAYGGVRITSLHGLLGIEELPIIVSYLLTIVFIVGITNAYNLIDGIDGLAGGLGGIGCTTLGLLLLYVQEYNYAILAFAITGSLIAFLRYNFGKYPNKIFMGDAGSLLLGLTITILSIQFIESPKALSALNISSPIGIIVGIIFIPTYDTLRVFTIRILKGQSPFQPDKSHIHHEFLRSKVGHLQTSILLWIGNVLIISAVLLFRRQDTVNLILIVLTIGSIFIHTLVNMRQRREARQVTNLENQLQEIQKENYLIQ